MIIINWLSYSKEFTAQIKYQDKSSAWLDIMKYNPTQISYVV